MINIIKPLKILKITLMIILTTLTTIILILYLFKINFNTSSSLPGLIYKESKPKHTYNKNDLVLVCPPKEKEITKKIKVLRTTTKSCKNSPPLLKKITGTPGDIITINHNGITINSTLIKNTKPIIRQKQPILIQTKLKDNEYIITGETPTSYDSRYLGIIPKKWILNPITKIL